jgi:hypothetical protein
VKNLLNRSANTNVKKPAGVTHGLELQAIANIIANFRGEFSRVALVTILYTDTLLDITDEAITLKKFSLLRRPKRLLFSEIERVEARAPSVQSGKWRIWGSGDFRTWFPFDRHRSQRDTIFVVFLQTSWRRLAFTAEDSIRVRRILVQKGLL